MASPYLAAAAQLTATNDLDNNLAVCRELAQRAAAEGAQLLALPECFAFLGASEREKFPTTEVLDDQKPGPVLQTLVDLSREHRMWISGGGIAERLESERDTPADQVSSAYNAHVVVSPEGRIVAKYRKIHLFDVDIPGKATLRESDSTEPGQDIVTATTELGVLGLSVCYDLRFPELFRTLAMRKGAGVLLVPAAFTAHTGAAHWHTLLRARAIENQCYVIAAAQAGKHNAKRESFGHSLIVDPWGEVVAEVEEGTGLAIAEISMDKVTQTRQKMPCHQHQTLSFH